MSQTGILDSLRQPEYTGENRCVPCTVVNVVISAAAAVAVGVFSPPIGVGVFLVSLAAIYLRGYLVPYTPTLTKRYFPDSVLRLFDKAPDADGPPRDDEMVNVEETLFEMGVVEECERRDDLCVSDGFGEAWKESIRGFRESDTDATHERIAELLELDTDRLSFDDYGDATVVLVDGQRAAQWESDAALIADLAADETLAGYDGWDELGVVNRSRVLNGLRIFLEDCPSCGGTVSMGQDTVESCCRSIDVVAVTCNDCGQRVFEAELSPEFNG